MKATVKTTHLKEAFDHVKKAKAGTVADRVALRVYEGGLYLCKYGSNIYTSAEIDCEDWQEGQAVTDNVADLISVIKEEYLEISTEGNSVRFSGENINIVRPLVSDDISDQVLQVDWPDKDQFAILKGERFLESAIVDTGTKPNYDNIVFLDGMAIAIHSSAHKSHYSYSDEKISGAVHVDYARTFFGEGFQVCLQENRSFFKKVGPNVELRAITPSTIDINSDVIKQYKNAKLIFGQSLDRAKDLFREKDHEGFKRWTILDASDLTRALSMTSYFKKTDVNFALFSLEFDGVGLAVESRETGDNDKFREVLPCATGGESWGPIRFSQKNFSLVKNSGPVLLIPDPAGQPYVLVYHPIIDVLQMIVGLKEK